MLTVLQAIATGLTVVALSCSLAHVLELPGKLRLPRDAYVTVQSIYYPGFTLAGLSEPLGILVLGLLCLLMPQDDPAFWWTLAAAALLVLVHGLYWLLTHPVNRFWVEGQDLGRLGRGFFGKATATGTEYTAEEVWLQRRNRWELSHVLRAIGTAGALALLLVSLTV
jgi:hypothetical protein